ncbi:DUF5131 family protein [Robertmurraya massiliosenegalensis]|uniref:DUF5131 family protein n=1 Tax=Robertmurraya massiliosenegalensis TaxID=1287657 RepID=UPI0002F33722|nr:phage Gp37/Gp68 family protein [Robertmurraya massiliosenegalensis]
MAGNSSIEWTEATWNPVTGCNKVSDGCKHCYAERMAKRLFAMGNPRYINGFKVTLHNDLINVPRKWNKPKRIFVNSMSDLFHEEIPLEFIKQVFKTMNETPHHSYQVLTKRPERVVELANILNFTPNIWMGTSIENEKVIHRIDILKHVPAVIRFLSCEPLLGPLDNLDLNNIHWVIAGGESGPGARPMEADWVRSIRDQCNEQKVAFFFKQWGGVQKHRFGRELDDKTYNEYPKLTLA